MRLEHHDKNGSWKDARGAAGGVSSRLPVFPDWRGPGREIRLVGSETGPRGHDVTGGHGGAR